MLKSVWFKSASTGFAVGGGWSFGTILKTSDAGVTWTSKVIPGSGLTSVQCPAINTGFTVGLNGQMLKTTDGGTNWDFLSFQVTSENLNSIHFPGVDIGFAAGDSGTILKTSNGGSVWETLNSGVNKSLRSVFFTSLSTGYAVGDSGTILKTTDGGSVWSSQFSGTTFNYYAVHFPSPDIGYIAGAGTLPGTLDFCAVILKTMNGGLNWSLIFSDTNHIWAMNTIFFTDVNTGFVGGGYWTGGFILRTTDGGATWSQTDTGQCRSICFPNQNTGFAVVNGTEPGNSNYLLKTTDGGITWTSYDFYAYFARSVYFANEDTGYVAGWEGEAGKGAILRTTDGGESWSTPLMIISREMCSLHFLDGQTGYIVGQRGVILKTTTGGGPAVQVESDPWVFESLKIYPNPASGKITVETPGLSKTGHLSIFNLSGQELLKQRILESKSTFDISRLCTGMYIIKVTDDQGVQVGKILKN